MRIGDVKFVKLKGYGLGGNSGQPWTTSMFFKQCNRHIKKKCKNQNQIKTNVKQNTKYLTKYNKTTEIKLKKKHRDGFYRSLEDLKYFLYSSENGRKSWAIVIKNFILSLFLNKNIRARQHWKIAKYTK